MYKLGNKIIFKNIILTKCKVNFYKTSLRLLFNNKNESDNYEKNIKQMKDIYEGLENNLDKYVAEDNKNPSRPSKQIIVID